MTVNDILDKIQQIDRLYKSIKSTNLDNADIDETMELLLHNFLTQKFFFIFQ